MDRELLVQNIERYCSKKGVKPTNACRDSGVGASFLKLFLSLDDKAQNEIVAEMLKRKK